MIVRRTCIAALLLLSIAACYRVKYSDYAEFTRKEARPLAQYERWLTGQGLSGVVPMEGLTRSATDWRKCKGQAYAVPPREYWPAIAPTLRLLEDEIKPLVGPVRVDSGWRSPKINTCAGGAKASKHMLYQALDLSPLSDITREDLIVRLCTFHRDHGARYNMGLGIYKGTRFHIDTGGYRRWGADYKSASSPCAAFD
jgi:Peptidase M15